MNNLPSEVIYEMCKSLDLKDLVQFTRTSMRNYQICNKFLEDKKLIIDNIVENLQDFQSIIIHYDDIYVYVSLEYSRVQIIDVSNPLKFFLIKNIDNVDINIFHNILLNQNVKMLVGISENNFYMVYPDDGAIFEIKEDDFHDFLEDVLERINNTGPLKDMKINMFNVFRRYIYPETILIYEDGYAFVEIEKNSLTLFDDKFNKVDKIEFMSQNEFLNYLVDFVYEHDVIKILGLGNNSEIHESPASIYNRRSLGYFVLFNTNDEDYIKYSEIINNIKKNL